MPTETVRLIFPPWDWVAFPGAPTVTTGEGGIHVGEIVPPYDLDNGVAFLLNTRTAEALYLRVAMWTLDGTMMLTQTNGNTYAGHVHLDVPAINYVDGGPLPPASTGGVALHGGWYGKDDAPAPWTFTPAFGGAPEDYDVGSLSLRFGERSGAAGNFFEGKIAFEPEFSGPGTVVGKYNDTDSCPVTCTFPAELLDYGETGFMFQLGAPFNTIEGGPPPTLTGSLTFNPTALYTY